MAGFQLGVVRLGRAAGKIKYALVDQEDIPVVANYAVEAHLNVDKDGDGAVIYAYAYDLARGKASGQYLHEMLWERHCGGVAAGWKVVHKNGVTVDNRLENLTLVPVNTKSSQLKEEPSNKNKETSLYWVAVQHLHVDPFHHQYFAEPDNGRLLTCNGDVVEDPCVYYECHYPPCTNMEKHIREFSICGRCQAVRYCGAYCQQKDWPVHKLYCREKQQNFIERPPDR